MNEKELIKNLKELKQIKPRKDWVILTKSRMLAEESINESFSVFSIFKYKLAIAPILGAMIVIGLFGFTQKTMPGDFLFQFKKIAETVQVGFSSNIDKPKVQLQLANKRLEELSQIAENNQVKNLGPALEEFQASIAQATRNLAEMDNNVTSSDPIMVKELVEETQKLTKNKEKLESVLGAKVGDTQELEDAVGALEKETIEYLIADLENRTLTEEKQELLNQAKQNYQEGLYQNALYNIWQAHNN